MSYFDHVLQRTVPDGRTRDGQPYICIKAFLFSKSGKYKYEVELDYRHIWHRVATGPEREAWVEAHPGEKIEYLDPNDAAWMALAEATSTGMSGVKFSGPECGYFLVVPDPPNGFPVMARPS